MRLKSLPEIILGIGAEQKTVRSALALAGAAAISLMLYLQWSHIQPAADDPTLLSWAAQSIPVPSDWGPFFVGFLRNLLFLTGDTAVAYAAFTVVISISSCFFFFVWLWKCSGNFSGSILGAVLYLMSGFSPASALMNHPNLPPSSLSGHFAAVFVLIGLVLLLHFGTKNLIAVTASGVSLLMASYCRPEFLWAALLVLTFAVWRTVSALAARERTLIRSEIIVGFTVLCFAGGLIFHWGLPLPDRDRALVAFGQHTALSFCEAHSNQCGAESVWGDWHFYFEKLFPNSASIITALTGHPAAFAEQIARNVIYLGMNFSRGLYCFPNTTLDGNASLLLPLSLWALTAIAFLLGGLKPPPRHDGAFFWAASAVAIAPQFVNLFLLFPRAHYLITPTLVGVGLVLIRLSKAPLDSSIARNSNQN